jgi:hypothetical protein
LQTGIQLVFYVGVGKRSLEDKRLGLLLQSGSTIRRHQQHLAESRPARGSRPTKGASFISPLFHGLLQFLSQLGGPGCWLRVALVGLTNEGNRGSEEQQIGGEKNGIRPYPLGVKLGLIGCEGTSTLNHGPPWLTKNLDLEKIDQPLNGLASHRV